MTNEEIQDTIQDLSRELEELSDSEKELTKQEKRHKTIVELRKETLEKLMEAREKGKSQQEFSLTMTYGLLSSVGEKYPFLVPFLKAKGGIGI